MIKPILIASLVVLLSLSNIGCSIHSESKVAIASIIEDAQHIDVELKKLEELLESNSELLMPQQLESIRSVCSRTKAIAVHIKTYDENQNVVSFFQKLDPLVLSLQDEYVRAALLIEPKLPLLPQQLSSRIIQLDRSAKKINGVYDKLKRIAKAGGNIALAIKPFVDVLQLRQ